MAPELAPRIASCKRGFERTVLTPVDWAAEHDVLVLPLSEDGKPLFPECVRCECSSVGSEILLMPDNDGTFHSVKTCPIRFRAADDTDDLEPRQEVG